MVTETSIERSDPEHKKTYSMFTGLVKWGTIAAVITAAIVVLIIAS